MLVDGGIVDNIPLASMKALKSGPNLVVHFGMPPARRHTVKYESIPGAGNCWAGCSILSHGRSCRMRLGRCPFSSVAYVCTKIQISFQ
jgi:predicted acylesterase/phospholipase RssA